MGKQMSSKYTVVYIPGEYGRPECLGLFDDKTDAVKYLEKDSEYSISHARTNDLNIEKGNDFCYVQDIGKWEVVEIIPASYTEVGS